MADRSEHILFILSTTSVVLMVLFLLLALDAFLKIFVFHLPNEISRFFLSIFLMYLMLLVWVLTSTRLRRRCG